MKLRIFPKQVDFFNYLCQCCNILIQITNELEVLFKDPSEENFTKIIDLEHKADNIVYEYRHKLNEVFITPLDREDLHQIMVKLDDIIDFVKSSAEKYFLYKPHTNPAFINDMISILKETSQKVLELVKLLSKPSDNIIKIVNEICDLERKADIVNRKALALLFNNGTDILEIIKIKEILSQLEETVDRMQMLAITVENSIFKHI